MTAVAESFIAPNSRLTAFERLEIYNRQYWFRVLGALAEDFPATARRRWRTPIRSALHRVPHGASQPLVHAAQSGLEAAGVARRASGSMTGRRHAAGRRCGAHRVGFRRGLRFGGTRAAHARSDRNPRWRFAARLQPHLRLMALDYPADDLVLGLHDQRESGRPAKPAWSTMTATRRRPNCRRCAAQPPGWPRIASISRSTTGGSSGRSFRCSRRSVEGLPLGEAIEAGFTGSRIATIPPCRNAFVSGLPTGLSWAGSAPPILNLCFKKRD